MPVSPAREAAFRVLQQVERGGVQAVELLQARMVSELKDDDRRLATEIVMGVLRRRGDLDYQIERLSRKRTGYFDPEILEVLRAGLYQIRYLDAVPKYAAVNESVELVKKIRRRSAAGLVNAVLRKGEPLKAADAPEAFAVRELLESARRAMPDWLLERWQKNFGPDAADSLALASASPPRVWLRVTGTPFERESARRELAEEGVATELGAFGSRALWVKSGTVTCTRACRERRVVIQDEASQLAGELAYGGSGVRALDLCAAPGMKALEIADSMNSGTLVVCDRSLARMRTLEKVVSAVWPSGVSRHAALLDAAEPLPFSTLFDVVLADVPCSGTGTLARNPEIKWRVRPDDLPRLAAQQVRILSRALGAAAPGGRVTYSTCSLEPEENEQVVEAVLKTAPAFRRLDAMVLRREFPHLAPLIGEDGYFRTFPGRHLHDGFFAAVIVRA